MKKLIFILIPLIALACSLRKGQPDSALLSDKIIIGSVDSLHSDILGEERKIWVYVPNSANPLYSTQKYPVVYLLDGDGHFHSVTGIIQQLSEINGNTVCPEMIVVGIPNTDRTRDLTPTHTNRTLFGDSSFVKTSGGGEKFTEFIEKELIPYIDAHYPTAPYRMLIGHSFGGLFTINALIHHTGLFNSFLAIDPSLWWDDQKLLKQADTVLRENRFDHKSLFLGIANTMDPGMDTLKVRKDTSKNSIHIRSILMLKDKLTKYSKDGLKWSFKYYNKDSHGSAPLITEYDGLRFIFSNFNLTGTNRFFEPSYPADSCVSVLTRHFDQVSDEMGYKILPPEPMVNGMAYGFLQNKMFDKALALFNLNLRNYPSSFNVFDSMGDYYLARNDTANAISSFTKALSLKEFPDTRKKLEKLKGVK